MCVCLCCKAVHASFCLNECAQCFSGWSKGHVLPLNAVNMFAGVEDVENELLKPAKQGTLNVLQSVSKSLDTVKRVVLTSSFAGDSELHICLLQCMLCRF